MKSILTLALCATTSLATFAETLHPGEKEGTTFSLATQKAPESIKKADPTITVGGFITGKYSITDKANVTDNGGFDMRYLRIYGSGYVYKDFFYRFQGEVSGAPGVDKGARLLDAFVEWQKYNAFRVKVGQFKRSFGFENPMSPLAIGHGAYSQATLKFLMNDRCGEHSSGGRDLGAQIQGDFLKVGGEKGHYLFHYQFGVFNGQGINHKDKDKEKDYIAGLWVRPLKKLEVGGFLWNGTYTNEANTQDQIDRKRMGFGVKYEDKWTVRAEYMYSYGGAIKDANAPKHSEGWYATVGVPVAKNFKVYGKWDCYRNDTRTWDSLKTDWCMSANYNFGKNLMMQLNYTYTVDRTPSLNDNHFNTVDFQISARF